MNFSRSVHPQYKGSFVWKRNVNSSENKRKTPIDSNKLRISSQSSNYSNLCETQPSINVKEVKQIQPKPKSKKSQWAEVKSLAKQSTIASRMQLKKSVNFVFLDKSTKKYQKKDKSKSNFEYSTFDRMIDSQGNLTKSFKQTKQFKSLNPHISKDVERMKKRVYSMYQQEKKNMNNFLILDSKKNSLGDNIEGHTKSTGFMTNYEESNGNKQMQKISQRQEYESRMNSTRVNKETQNNYEQQLKQKPIQIIKEHSDVGCNKQIKQNKIQTVPVFIRSSKRVQNGKDVKNAKGSSQSVLSNPQNNNKLLKGLLGEYENYQKLSKHQLIQKLISLEYLAQNIFKKNKYLQQEIEKKDIFIERQVKKGNMNKREQDSIEVIKEERENEGKGQLQGKQQQAVNMNDSRNIFVINNQDGYFNEFLQSQKAKQQNAQRFRQDERLF